MYNVVISNRVYPIVAAMDSFKRELGFAKANRSEDKNRKANTGEFGFHKDDLFAKAYYNKFNQQVNRNGTYGTLTFYTNNYFSNLNRIEIYDASGKMYDFEYNEADVMMKGITAFMGSLLKIIIEGTYTEYKQKIADIADKKEQEKVSRMNNANSVLGNDKSYNRDLEVSEVLQRGVEGSADAVHKHPGSVTFADIQAYLEKRKKPVPKIIGKIQ